MQSGLSSREGGLLGVNGGTITNGYSDNQTTGQTAAVGYNSGTGSATALTTAQLQGLAPLPNGTTFSLGAAFAGGAASPGTGGAASAAPGFYPYLTAFYPTAPHQISGTAYAGVSGGPLAGVDVGVVLNGTKALPGVTTGADGYYYALVPGGTLDGATVLTYLSGATNAHGAAVYADAVDEKVASGASAGGLRLAGGALSLITTDTTLTSAQADLAGAPGAATAALPAGEITFTPAQPLAANESLYLGALGPSFDFDASLDLGTGLLHLNKTLTDVGEDTGVVVTARRLAAEVGSLTFAGHNAIGALQNFKVSDATGLTLNDAVTLRIGNIYADFATPNGNAAGPFDLSTDSGANLVVTGYVANGYGGALTLASGGRLLETAGSRIVTIAPSGGASAILSSVGGMRLLGQNDNQAVSLTNTGGGAISYDDGGANPNPVTIVGLANASGSAKLTGYGGLTFAGDVTVGKTLELTTTVGTTPQQTGDIVLASGTLSADVLKLNSAAGVQQTGGTLGAAVLEGSSAGAVTLDQAGNTIGRLASFSTGGTGFALADGEGLTLAKGATLDTGAATAQLTTGTGDILIDGTVDAGTLTLHALEGSLRESAANGAIVVDTINATASGFVDLQGQGNQITAIGTDSAGPHRRNTIDTGS